MRALIALASLTAACFLLPTAHAATRAITNCNDTGPGSLRATIAGAQDGDTIDASLCTGIDIATQIPVPQDNLEIVGGPNRRPYVSSSLRSRILRHFGRGTLRLRSIYITNGRHRALVGAGGCIYSPGRVELRDAIVGYCEAVGTEGTAFGGAIHADSVSARYSFIWESDAMGTDTDGGGVHATGHVSLYRTEVTGNTATNGGGVSTLGGATITYSTLRGNAAGNDGGGLQALGGDVTVNKSLFLSNSAVRRCGALCVLGSGRTVVLNSTLSGNRARYLAGGQLSSNTTISNSTIAFNVDDSTNQCTGTIRARTLRLESTIAALNTCRATGEPSYDIGGRTSEGYTLTGSNNLIRQSKIPVPPDTISANPMLQTLLDNGGPTMTHALLRSSPALDRGNNKVGQLYDQRGPGFPRVLGARADIGAHEGICAD